MFKIFTSFTFEGTEEIQIEISESISEISLNSVDLEIFNAKFISNDILDSYDLEISLNNELLKLDFGQDVLPQSGILKIDFKGVLSDDLKGFYKASYKDENNNVKYLATTQFEATDARRAFPCWDEPAFKSTFSVKLCVPDKFSAVSKYTMF